MLTLNSSIRLAAPAMSHMATDLAAHLLRPVLEGILLQKSIFADDKNSAGRGRDLRVQDVWDLAASPKIHRRLR